MASLKVNVQPGTPVFVGRQIVTTPEIELVRYSSNECETHKITSVEEIKKFIKPGSNIWLNIEGLHDTSLIADIGKLFGIHEMITEDVLDTTQRPKADTDNDQLYCMVKMLSTAHDDDGIVSEHISFVLSEQALITFQEGSAGDVFDPVRNRLINGKGRVRTRGADYLFYELLDLVIDNYANILEGVGDDIERIEDLIMERPRKDHLNKIHFLRREINAVRKYIRPFKELLHKIEISDSHLIEEQNRIFFKDLTDHISSAAETIELYRDWTANVQDLYMSAISNRMNEIMKVLTVITTIFIPLSFIAGVYGMNFKFMPELESPFGYPVVMTTMFIIALAMLLLFKRKKWF